MTLEFNTRVADIPIYPAAATYAFDGQLVKLASNETPWPPHPQVLEAVEAAMRALNRYPDPAKALLRRGSQSAPACRRAHRRRERVLRDPAGRGDAMLEPGAEIVYAWPSFSIYPHLAAMTGARAVTCRSTRRGATTWTRWPARSPPPPGS